MQFNPDDIPKLRESMKDAIRMFSTYNSWRKSLIEQYVGPHYGDATNPSGREPVNYIEQAVSIYQRKLAPRRPRVLVTTQHKALKPNASSLQQAVNAILAKIRIETTIREVALNAMFGLGIFKVGLTAGMPVNIDGEDIISGQVFVDSVSQDDWVQDPWARKYHEALFAGHKFRIPYDTLKQTPYDQDAVKRMVSGLQNGPKTQGQDRAERVGHGKPQKEPFVPIAELWNLYLPQHNVVVTIADQEDINVPLYYQEWEGPNGGPFIQLGFGDVPDNPMPLTPLQSIIDFHLLANELWVKVGRQADRQKTVTIVPPESADEGGKIVSADDGDTILASNPDRVKEHTTGGADPNTLALLSILKGEKNELGGNLAVMGGLGAQSPTLGQDRLLAENASTRLSEYQDRTRDAVEQVCQAVAGYVWDDPLSEIPIVKTAMGVEVTSTYAPEMRQGEFVDYNFRLDVYSMQDQTPESIANSLVETMERSILPLSQQAEQQGLTLDVRKWIDVLAESRNLPQLRDLWTSLDAPILPNDNPQTKSPNTTRRYVRENRASMTGPGKDALLTQALLGKKMQPAMSAERG